MNNKVALFAVVVILLAGVAITITKSNKTNRQASNMSVNGHMTPQGPNLSVTQVVEPAFDLNEKRGESVYKDNCAQCHGPKTTGTKHGPPFLNPVYSPGHHDDGSFFNATKNGVNQHHWPFGNMPPQPQVSKGDVASIIAYVRALQTANGIY